MRRCPPCCESDDTVLQYKEYSDSKVERRNDQLFYFERARVQPLGSLPCVEAAEVGGCKSEVEPRPLDVFGGPPVNDRFIAIINIFRWYYLLQEPEAYLSSSLPLRDISGCHTY